MAIDIDRELLQLQRLTTVQLRQRYLEVFDEAARSSNKTWLIKRIAWRLQAMAEGDLSDRARQRAAALARDADLRLAPPRRGQPVRTAKPFRTGQAQASSAPAARSIRGCLRPVHGLPAPTRDKPST
jgi:hypothetical protein